jgi:hypothetical protein
MINCNGARDLRRVVVAKARVIKIERRANAVPQESSQFSGSDHPRHWTQGQEAIALALQIRVWQSWQYYIMNQRAQPL